MYNVKKSRLITCFIIGLVSNILFWLSITCFDIVFLILSLAAMILVTTAALQCNRTKPWIFNTISYILGLILSFSVEIILVLFDFTHSDSGVSYADAFSIFVLGTTYFCAYLFGIAGSFITTLVRKCVSK